MSMTILETYGQLLNRFRRERRLTAAALADEAGVSQSYVVNLERHNHRRTGSLEVLRGLALGLGVDWVELLASWIRDKGGVFFEAPQPRDIISITPAGKKIYILTLLRRNWDRMTRADLERLSEVLTGIHERWPTN
jgi:transcriptional regulator with XRE-family HTH domain